MAEKRLYRRVEIGGTARLDIGGQTHPVELLDLSLKGAQVEVASDLAGMPLSQSQVKLVLELEDSDIQLPIEGVVVRQQGKQLAMEFTHVRVESMQHLRRLVELNLGSDPILDLPGSTAVKD